MASKLVLRSFNKISSYNRIFSTTFTHAKTNFKPVLNLNKSFSVSSYLNQQSNENSFKSLSAYLKEEIKLEKEQQVHKKLPVIAGFESKTEGPNVTLSKTYQDEQITIKLNVVDTVSTTEHEDDPEIEPGKEEPEIGKMKSKPGFTIDIKRGGKTLSFECEYLESEGKDAPEDFEITHFAIHDGDWNEHVYTASCDLLDGTLYDKLLQVLDERGIGEEFANQLVELSTAHEHNLYIGLLEQLHSFSK